MFDIITFGIKKVGQKLYQKLYQRYLKHYNLLYLKGLLNDLDDSGSCGSNPVEVRVLSSAPNEK